jgi:hypothetical protein
MLSKLFAEYREESSPVLAQLRHACIPVLLNAITAHMSQRQMVSAACACLREACISRKVDDLASKRREMEQFITWAQKKGSISTMTQIMNAHPDDEDTQHVLIFMIQMMVAASPNNQDVCRKCGTIDAIIRASKLHKESRWVLLISREALNVIASNHKQNSEYVKQHLSGKLAAKMKMSPLEDMEKAALDCGWPQEVYEKLKKSVMERINAAGPEITEELAQAREREKLAQKCVGCGKTAADMGVQQLLKCSGCSMAPLYCGSQCQKAQWKEHKAECKANRKKA